MRALKLLLLLIFMVVKGLGQTFYVSSQSSTSPYGSTIVRVTKVDTGFVTQALTSCSPSTDQFYSIAISHSTIFWFNQYTLNKATISGNSIINCSQIMYGVNSNSLTIGDNGKLYYAGGDLISIDTTTMALTDRKSSPGFYPSGDLTFYKGSLYMVGSLGFTAGSSGIVKIDTSNLANSTVVIPSTSTFFGLITLNTSKHSSVMYAIQSASSTKTNIYQVDLTNKTITLAGSIPYGGVLDAAAPGEDGTIEGITVDKINIHKDCNTQITGIAEITTVPSTHPLTYQLSNGQTNTSGIFSNLSQGVYQLKITSSVDEVDTTFTVPAYQKVKPVYTTTIKNSVCDTLGSITVSTSNGNADPYQISSGAAMFPINHTFTKLAAGTYRYTVIDASGCNVDTINVVIPRDKCHIAVDSISINKECSELSKGRIAVNTKPHSQTYIYSLNGVSNTTGLFGLLNPGNYSVSITSIEDTLIKPITIPDYSLTNPVFTFKQSNPVCDTLGKIQFFTTTGGNYNVTFNTVTTSLNKLITGIPIGVNHFVITNVNGCVVAIKDISFTPNKCTIKFDSVATAQQCDALHKGTAKFITNAHKDTYTYTLNGTSNQTGAFDNLAPGSYAATIISPSDTVNTSVVIPDYRQTQPVITYSAINPACAVKGSISFNIQNEALYQISYNGANYPADHLFSNLSAGAYHFTVLTKAGCIIDNYDVTLVYQPCPVVINKVDIVQECNVLEKGVLTVTCAPIPETYTYNLNGVINSTGVFNMLDPGSYQLLVTDSGGGTPQSRTVVVPDFNISKPITVINKKNQICDLPGNINLNVENGSSNFTIQYQSASYPSNFTFTNLLAGNYTFNILKKDGCLADIVAVTLIKEACHPVSFPNTFTPNGDGINDVFRANPESLATNFLLKIYDRWGAMIYSSTDIHAGWDGNYKGRPAAAGTYYWKATFLSQQEVNTTLEGFAALIR